MVKLEEKLFKALATRQSAEKELTDYLKSATSGGTTVERSHLQLLIKKRNRSRNRHCTALGRFRTNLADRLALLERISRAKNAVDMAPPSTLTEGLSSSSSSLPITVDA